MNKDKNRNISCKLLAIVDKRSHLKVKRHNEKDQLVAMNKH